MPDTKSAKPTVIFDRDGTLIVDKHYLHKPSEVELLPHVISGLQLLQQAGFRMFIATNQSGIGRGYYTLDAMHAVHERLNTLLASANIFLDGIYYCPHAPETQCICRKPNLGMIKQIEQNYSINPHTSFVVGDKACDIVLGQNADMRSILVRTGYGQQEEKKGQCKPHAITNTIEEAASLILADSIKH